MIALKKGMENKYSLKLMKRKELSETTILLTFKRPKKFSFEAGQYIILDVKNQKENKPTPYSIISNPSKKDEIELCIKIVGGFATDILKDMKIKETIEAKGPFGKFNFKKEKEEKVAVFIATGTGIAPLYSMIKEYVPKYPKKKFKLLFGTKYLQDLIFYEKLKQLKTENKNFEYVPILSREEKWEGAKGHVQDHLGENLSGKNFYLCGLKDMIIDTKNFLLNKGVKAENIYFERYS
jgi:NAD(P)H-flavin reductase